MTASHEPLAQALSDAETYLRRFVVLPEEWAYTAAVLWCAHTHVYDAFDTTPRLAFMSPEPGSGKSRALEICEKLAANPEHLSNASAAYVMRALASEDGCTLLLDEVDTIFGKASDSETLRGMVNAGYRKGAKSGRAAVTDNGVQLERFDSFAPVALAGLADLPDTIATRAIVVHMRRRLESETVEAFRLRDHEPEGHKVRAALWETLQPLRGVLTEARPDLPPTVTDRNADVWEPLIVIADSAGDDWSERARTAAVEYIASSRSTKISRGVSLLADLRRILRDRTEDVPVRSGDLVADLCRMEEGGWVDDNGKGITPQGMASLLRPYGIRPRQIRALNGKGYQKADFTDAWARYLPPEGGEPLQVVPMGGA